MLFENWSVTGRHNVSPPEGGGGYIAAALLKPLKMEALKAVVDEAVREEEPKERAG